MKQKILFLSIVLAALILVGASCNNKEITPVNESASKPEKKAQAAVFKPLKLEYTLNNFGPGNQSTITYYLESKQKCGDREAYLGLAKLEVKGQNIGPQYAKITIYADNGEMAVSRWNNESNLAFDDSAATFNDMNIPLAVNDIFIAAGKNFNSPEYWQTNIPTVLKDVASGRSKGNYSVIPQAEDNTALVPCTKFKLVAKTTNTDGFFNACVAKEVGGITLPFVVSMAFENNQGPFWQLTSFVSEKSGLAWIPQCLAAVKCVYVSEPEPAERSVCEAGGQGRMESIFDDQGCVTQYKCATELDQAKAALSHTQRPTCGVNQAVLNKYLACRKNNQVNYNPTKYDENGCLLDITCRP